MARPTPLPNERNRKLGNPGHKQLPTLGDVESVGAIESEPPDSLGDAGSRFWRAAVSSTSWLAETDWPAMVLLAELIDRRADFIANLADSGPVLRTDKGYAYPNPLAGMLSSLERQIFALLGSLGFTPADRTRLGVAEVTAQSAFEEMLARRQRPE